MAHVDFHLSGDNLYGRKTLPEMRTLVSETRVRKARHLDSLLVHRMKNGINDPLTFYHILDLILQMAPGTEFRTSELMVGLREFKDQLVWDSTVVGRVIADMADSLEEQDGFQPIQWTRRWNGMYYALSTDPKTHVVLFNLLQDLVRLSEELIKDELKGEHPKRFTSPLGRCPSLGYVASNSVSG